MKLAINNYDGTKAKRGRDTYNSEGEFGGKKNRGPKRRKNDG